MKRVLVTAIGTAAATTIVTELKKQGSFCVLGADINPACEISTSRDVDEFFVFPPAVPDTEAFFRFVLDFCKEHGVQYYFAVIDEEVLMLAEHRAEFEEIGVKPCVANTDLVRTCHFKDRFNRWLGENFPAVAIKTFPTLDEIGEEDYPLFVKPVEGRASIGCKRIDNSRELHAVVKPEDCGTAVIIQKLTEGEIITTDVIRNAATGQIALLSRVELLRNANGCGIAVKTIYDQTLADYCRQIAEKLDLNGVVNMEFFRNGKEYKAIEINPRFSAGAAFSCLAGIDLAGNAIRIADGEACEFGEIKCGKHYAKRYEAYEMD